MKLQQGELITVLWQMKVNV